ncbi:hypothetical protein KSF_065690 [Reticulibacter mediterranei]|uniref:TIR domain-containing protein n=2 Tax=Reticulibacter mediterranei TaxID=2778369 RepID=A0A8J3IL48_9CHLR|nr:hypothetical protein KSF_065690 [Reticulibacter mediterranei]
MVVPIARTADGQELQDELIRDWYSLDDLTSDHILVIMPRPSRRLSRAEFQYVGDEPDFCEDLSVLEGRPSAELKNKLKRYGSKEGNPVTNYGLPSSLLFSRESEERKEALTRAATETARFFGIPERYLPCIVVLSPKEKQIFLLPFYASFSLYAFVKSLTIEYQPVIESMQAIKERRKELQKIEQTMPETNKELKTVITRYRSKKENTYKILLMELREKRKIIKEEIIKERSEREKDIQQLIDELNVVERERPLSKAISSVADHYALKPSKMSLRLHSSLSEWHVTLLEMKKTSTISADSGVSRLPTTTSSFQPGKEEGPGMDQDFIPASGRYKPPTEQLFHQIDENITTNQIDTPVKIFYCYAREDEKFREKLDEHLKLLIHQNSIITWYDRQIIPGTEWRREITTHLCTSHIILLLVSPSFMASNYCYGIEMMQALEMHRTQAAHVIPVILRPVSWKDSPFSELQCLPQDAKPVTRWKNTDDAFLDITKGIHRVVREITSRERG